MAEGAQALPYNYDLMHLKMICMHINKETCSYVYQCSRAHGFNYKTGDAPEQNPCCFPLSPYLDGVCTSGK